MSWPLTGVQLRDILERINIKPSDFARLCSITPQWMGDILDRGAQPGEKLQKRIEEVLLMLERDDRLRISLEGDH
jgi:hypothetical protein